MAKSLEQRVRELEIRDEAFHQQVKIINFLKTENSKLRTEFDSQQCMLVELLSTFESFCSNIDSKLLDVESCIARHGREQEDMRRNIESLNESKSLLKLKRTKSVKKKVEESPENLKHRPWSSCSEGIDGVFTKDIRESLQSLSINISPPKPAKRRSDISDGVFMSDDEDTIEGTENGGENYLGNRNNLFCDICKEICRRAVKLDCCNGQACYNCAIKYKNSMPHDDRVCWRCGAKMLSDPVKHTSLRKRVSEFQENNQGVKVKVEMTENNKGAQDKIEPTSTNQDVKVKTEPTE